MLRPNPKDYPFNYVAHFNDEEYPLENYQAAEDFLAQFPKLMPFDAHWSSNDRSEIHAMPCEAANTPSKLAWNPGDLKTFLECDVWDNDSRMDEMIELVNRQFRVERHRDAYESALQDYQFEAYSENCVDESEPDLWCDVCDYTGDVCFDCSEQICSACGCMCD